MCTLCDVDTQVSSVTHKKEVEMTSGGSLGLVVHVILLFGHCTFHMPLFVVCLTVCDNGPSNSCECFATFHIVTNDPKGSQRVSPVVLVCFRPVCPSGDGGVLELCSSLSPLDPLPYSTWPFTYSASLEGEQKVIWDSRALRCRC